MGQSYAALNALMKDIERKMKESPSQKTGGDAECEYCGNRTKTDGRGCCAHCGAPRKRNECATRQSTS